MSDDPRDRGAAPLDWIDPVIHAPSRLSVVIQLYVVEAMHATFLVNRTGLTSGNLSTHLTKLEESGYVAVEKEFRGKKPCTMFRLTEKGREAFRGYRAAMQETLGSVSD